MVVAARDMLTVCPDHLGASWVPPLELSCHRKISAKRFNRDDRYDCCSFTPENVMTCSTGRPSREEKASACTFVRSAEISYQGEIEA